MTPSSFPQVINQAENQYSKAIHIDLFNYRALGLCKPVENPIFYVKKG